MQFEKIAPYLEEPMVLVGFVLFLFFGLAHASFRAGFIPTLTRRDGYRVVMRLMTYGFVLALAVVVVGLGLKYRELSEQEQRAAVRLLEQEIVGNIEVVGELQKNIENILRNTRVVHDSLRHPRIRLLSTLFPVENTDPEAVVPASLDYARQQMEIAQTLGLFENKLELSKFAQASKAIVGTIKRTMQTFENLADVEGKRYRISDNVWQENLPILRKVHIVDVPTLQSIYQDMASLRTNYTISTNYAIQYLKLLRTFFSNNVAPYTPERLAVVLAAERIFITTTIGYGATVADKIADIDAARKALAGS